MSTEERFRSPRQYATIVADPPWSYPEGWPVTRIPKGATHDGRRTPLKYPALSVAEIAALPVATLAADDAHLYLWTTNRYLWDAPAVVTAWGFRVSQVLVWAKTPQGLGPGGAFAQNAEFIVFCRRGHLAHRQRVESVWYNWRRTAKHSVKPDAMLDLVETVSPGPYVELFARRARFGWDYWGDESLSTVA